jgi:hypothetical protein
MPCVLYFYPSSLLLPWLKCRNSFPFPLMNLPQYQHWDTALVWSGASNQTVFSLWQTGYDTDCYIRKIVCFDLNSQSHVGLILIHSQVLHLFTDKSVSHNISINPVKTISGAHPASCTMLPRVFPESKVTELWQWPSPHLAPKLRKGTAIPLLSLSLSLCLCGMLQGDLYLSLTF